MEYFGVLAKLMRVLVVVGVVFGRGGLCAQKLRLYWLNNGGATVDSQGDQIKITLASTASNVSITCPKEGTFTYRPGTVHHFNNLYVPAEGVVLISIQKINQYSSNQGVSINHFINSSQIGFYTASLTIQKIVQRQSVGLEYMGFGINVETDGYTLNADYYMLFELTTEEIDINNYQVPSQCVATDKYALGDVFGMFGWVGVVLGLVVMGLM